jgi:hypothetical protein
MKFSDIKVIKDETIDEQPLPEYTPWVQIVGRPTSLSDLNLRDAEALAEAEEAIEGLGDMAYEDAVEKAKLGATIIEGGYLKTGFVDASRIDTGTLNAARVSIGSDSNFESGYDPSTKLETDDVGDLAFEDLVEEAKLGSTIIDGGYIKSSLLTADNIITGTLTGRTIRTDEPDNARVAMLGETDTLEWITSSNATSTEMKQFSWAQGSGFQIDHWGGATIKMAAGTSIFYIELDVDGDGYLSVNQDGVDIQSDLDMNDYDIRGIDNLYVQDIYGNGVSEIDIYEDIDMNNHNLSDVEDLVVDGLSIFNSAVAFQTSIIKMGSLPTSEPPIAGYLWNDGGTVKVST